MIRRGWWLEELRGTEWVGVGHASLGSFHGHTDLEMIAYLGHHLSPTNTNHWVVEAVEYGVIYLYSAAVASTIPGYKSDQPNRRYINKEIHP